jgi:phage tail-like protein
MTTARTPGADGDSRTGQSSSYLTYLPAVLQQDVQADQPNTLGRFLLAFEQVLTGLGDPAEPGLEEVLDGIIDPVSGERLLGGLERYFDPGPDLQPAERAPAEFLDWLAGWVGLTLRADLDELRRRDFIARAVALYRLRGTRRGLEEVVRIYTRLGVTINELNTPFQIGVHSTLGEDTLLDGGPPHFFRVLARLPTTDPAEISAQRQVITAILDQEKPAHTYYALDVETPVLQIGVHSTAGVDTLLGSATN